MMARNRAAQLFRLQKKWFQSCMWIHSQFFNKFLNEKNKTNKVQARSVYFWLYVLKVQLYMFFKVQNRHVVLQNKRFFFVVGFVVFGFFVVDNINKSILNFIRGFNRYSLTWPFSSILSHAFVCIKYVPIL